MELRFREFRKEDMDALYFLDQRCHPPEARSTFSGLLDNLLDRDAAALVAEEMAGEYQRVIGALIVRGDPWNSLLYIVSLMVNEEFRRLGIARRLLAWAEQLAIGFECKALLAPLAEGNEAGEAFLGANGFLPVEGELPPGFAGEGRRLWRREVAHEPTA